MLLHVLAAPNTRCRIKTFTQLPRNISIQNSIPYCTSSLLALLMIEDSIFLWIWFANKKFLVIFWSTPIPVKNNRNYNDSEQYFLFNIIILEVWCKKRKNNNQSRQRRSLFVCVCVCVLFFRDPDVFNTFHNTALNLWELQRMEDLHEIVYGNPTW